ncbi:MAG TPA: hypothetical protein VH280_25720 [Verrucomicrobiae bacterium]|jgi:DNA-binding MarR family transcriptional regulator|nr:hypothetical protein [Verrucomicrobiae bacterium]
MKELPPSIDIFKVPFEFIRAAISARLTHCQFHLLVFIYMRGRCFQAVRGIACDCRMNHDYVRLVTRQLVNLGMITRTRKGGPNNRNLLVVTPMGAWTVKTAVQKAAEEKAAQSTEQRNLDVKTEFWSRLKTRLNHVEAEIFATLLAEDAEKFERVMVSMAARIADARAGRQPKVQSVQALWRDYWSRYK